MMPMKSRQVWPFLFLWVFLPGARCSAPPKDSSVPLALRTQPPEFRLSGTWRGCTSVDSENSALLELSASKSGFELKETLYDGLNCKDGAAALRTVSRYSSWVFGPYESNAQARSLDLVLEDIQLTPLRAELASEMSAAKVFEHASWKVGRPFSPLDPRRKSPGSRFAKGDAVYGVILPTADGGLRIGLPLPLGMDAAAASELGSSEAKRWKSLMELPLYPIPP